MTSIQKQAAELAEEFESCGDEYTETGIAYRMADLLRQIPSMGGGLEPVAWGNIESEMLDKDRALFVNKKQADYYHENCYELAPLFTQQALDTARLAGFEAGQNRPWAARKIESLIQERDAAIARAEKAERSLVQAGYTDQGGELWKPPLGPARAPRKPSN